MGCNSSSSAEVIDSKTKSPRPNPNLPTLRQQETKMENNVSNRPVSRKEATQPNQSNQPPKQKYKLTYFDFNGRAEITRLLFAAGNIEYEDCRVSFNEWSQVKSKMPTEKVPVLEIDNQMFLVQSMAIARYVAKQASNLIIIFSRLVFFQFFFKSII
jgi:hypothetical protein